MINSINTGHRVESPEDKDIIAKAEVLRGVFSKQDLEILAKAFFVNGTPNVRDVHRRPPQNLDEMGDYDRIMRILDSAAGTKFTYGMDHDWLEG